ncbi:MAG: hypothetical protein JJ975_02230 [Bacteroidia bacterium]|nr:hypothetical protein [Bacteroidia bacterium]
MIQKLKTAAYVCLALGLFSCNGLNGGVETVEVEGLYSIELPTYMMKATEELNEDASLQYENGFREMYIEVIDESKQEFIDIFRQYDLYHDSLSVVQNYRLAQIGSVTEDLKVSSQAAPVAKMINGLNSETVQVDGFYEGVDEEISYLLTAIEGDENLYLVMMWMLASDKEEKLPIFQKMVDSFKLMSSDTEEAPEAEEEVSEEAAS